MKNLTKKDIKRKTDAFKKKVDEYNEMSLEELKTLFETTKPGGIYKEALIRVVDYKLQQEKIQRVKELTDTTRPTKEVQSVEQQEAPETSLLPSDDSHVSI